MSEKIKFSGYAGAPEMSRASVNGQPLPITGTKAAYYIACRDFEKARQELKREYRKHNRTERKYIYAFWGEDSKQFYYISILQFSGDADIKTRLYNYKELKHYLQKNPPELVTESGHITPAGAETPHRETVKANINYSRLFKICIA